MDEIPDKSALSRARQKVSFNFFQSTFESLVLSFEPRRQKFRGLRIYGVDGQQLILPRSKDIVKAGFTGKAHGKYRESYMPRGYLTHAYDVLSRVTKDFRFSPILNEIHDAKDMLKGFEKESLVLYDRLYFHPGLAKAHEEHGNFYIARCRRNACKEVQEFFEQTSLKKKTFILQGSTVFLTKIKNSNPDHDEEKEKWIVFASNLPQKWRKTHLIVKLYRLRWEAENSFKELTAITKVEQWHTKFANGIYQELYALMWMINFTKIHISIREKKPRNPCSRRYQRTNFKLIFNFLLNRLIKILKRIRGVMNPLDKLIKKYTETRKHFKRSYPRELKSPASPYPRNNTLWMWEVKA